MLISFFESIKHRGHLWPIALIRIYCGYYFLHKGFLHLKEGLINKPLFDSALQKIVIESHSPFSLVTYMQGWVANHWALISEAGVIALVVVGVSYILGFMVRPASVLAILLSLNFLVGATGDAQVLAKTFIGFNLMFFLIAAGRCLGFDYYFYKRVRGVWW